MAKIVIPGGSGAVGRVLGRAFAAGGHDVVVLTARAAEPRAQRRRGTGARSGAWARELDGADVVINLAGRSVNCRYTEGEPAPR